jgi:predicted NUDIX family NTP pyrophosphohydrolase
MTVRNTIRLVVYRIHEKGLEVLLTKTEGTDANWILMNAKYNLEQLAGKSLNGPFIELNGPEGTDVKAIAIEADWHELPRVRELLMKDLHFVKDTLKHKLPEMENSAYVAVKEAFKKMLPQEYAFLKELKDILLDRNTVKNI